MNHPNLTKICAICGKRKPLTAFLQLAGSQGNSYGNICASCRKIKDKNAAKDEGKTTHRTDLRIGSKEKVKIKKDEREFLQHLKEDYDEEHKKILQEKEEEIEKAQTLEKQQKEFRSFFERRSTPTTQKISPAEVVDARQKTTQAGQRIVAKEEAAKSEKINLEKISHEERLKKGIETTGTFMGPATTGMIKWQSPFVQEFAAWLRGESAVSKVVKGKDAQTKNQTGEPKLSDIAKNELISPKKGR